MILGVPEICQVIADEIVRLVQIYRERILKTMVNGTSETDHGILARLERKIITVTRELPYCLYNRKEVREYAFSSGRIL